jgi:glutamate dehydrogenase (NAD(P)+)
VVVVPEFLANVGGIIAAAHSMNAWYPPFTVDPACSEMNSTTMRANAETVIMESRRRRVTRTPPPSGPTKTRFRGAMSLRSGTQARRTAGRTDLR